MPTTTLLNSLPKEAGEILLVLFLSFLVGLEREQHKAASENYGFGGVRTFPLIGLLGYMLALLSGGNLILPGIGLAVIGTFLWQSYRYKLEHSPLAGMTSEISGLLIYAIGVLIFQEQYWIATAITVIGVVLLELKAALESLTKTVPGEEILTFAKFLLLSAVILPVVPNEAFGPFAFNPFKAWLVVVAVSTISYGSYLLQKAMRGQSNIILSALVGGAYSSTLTTVVLAKRGKASGQPHLFAGATLVACGMMYLRLLALLAIFNKALFHKLGIPFLGLATIGTVGGWALSMRRVSTTTDAGVEEAPKNPLEMSAALLFGLLFVVMLIGTHYALIYLGRTGFYTLAAFMGVTDVDPFILSLTQSAGAATPLATASAAIAIAAASNNVVKGIYARSFSNQRTGTESLVLLIVFALLGLVALAW
jgi:uncharacterized membrane protein (DUF4010 family)